MNKQSEILNISKKLGLSHIGSCLSVLPILEEIYSKKKPKDKVILDGAHAHLSHLMFINPKKAESLIEKYGIHCDKRAGCDAYGGSLGHGLGISIGLALANPKIKVYCIVSDGSMMEGSNWEALRIINYFKIKNIKIYCNFNGYTATTKLTEEQLYLMQENMENFLFESLDMRSSHGKNLTIPIQFERTENGKGFEGVQGHYKKL